MYQLRKGDEPGQTLGLWKIMSILLGILITDDILELFVNNEE